PAFIVNATFEDPIGKVKNDKGRVMWYHAPIPKDFDTNAPVQLSEWTIRDAKLADFAPDIAASENQPIFNYDVSYWDNLTFPVVMEITDEPTMVRIDYNGPAIPAAPFGAVGADISPQEMQQAFAAFTATTAGQNNSLLGTYFEGKGYDKFYFPSGLDSL